MATINSSLNLIDSKFSFLRKCGFDRNLETDTTALGKYTIVIFQNETYEKRIEIVISHVGDFITFNIRRKILDWAQYDDRINNLIESDLALLSMGIDYDPHQYSFNIVGREKIIENVAKLFFDLGDIICSKNWFDINMLQKLNFQYYKEKLNIDLSIIDEANNTPLQFNEGMKFFIDRGYTLAESSGSLPFYKSMVWFATYSDGANIIKIKQRDWRDSPGVYDLTINGKAISEFLIENYVSSAVMVNHVKYTIDEHI